MSLFCIDTSAWHHSSRPEVAGIWRRHLERDELAICDQVRLEILYSAQSAGDYDALGEELAGLRPLSTESSAFARALEVQRRLAHRGGLHHRSVKIADLVIAAVAESSGATILHYDADYDRISAITGQATQWIVARGSL
ncbi:MAG TPA: PIN domain nuclease [Thermoanaerobaculia bacterium]|nr:PIN domain nuclease [Thermoanaerobaculia bacterium]